MHTHRFSFIALFLKKNRESDPFYGNRTFSYYCQLVSGVNSQLRALAAIPYCGNVTRGICTFAEICALDW